MFPFIDTGDPAQELAQATPHPDDISWASFLYPEGTASSGLPALQTGDVAFRNRYGVISGNVRHGVLNQDIAGAAVQAEDVTGAIAVGAYSGTTRLSFNPANGGLDFLPTVADSIVDGKYSLPVPMSTLMIGKFLVTLPFTLYELAIEAVDGTPTPAGSISFTAQVGAFFGQQNFNEEGWNWFRESDLERSSGDDTFVVAVAGFTTPGINFTTNETVNINSFGIRDFIGFTGAAAGTYYAVRVPASVIASSPTGPNFLVHSAQYDTAVLDASVAPVFAEATLTTGTISGTTATLNLADPLARKTRFLAQDNDFAPFHIRLARSVGAMMRERLAVAGTDVFLVLRVPTTPPFPGVSALPPLIGLDGGVAMNDVAIFGLSYTSTDGVTFTQNPNSTIGSLSCWRSHYRRRKTRSARARRSLSSGGPFSFLLRTLARWLARASPSWPQSPAPLDRQQDLPGRSGESRQSRQDGCVRWRPGRPASTRCDASFATRRPHRPRGGCDRRCR
jgi:hypothetical protein